MPSFELDTNQPRPNAPFSCDIVQCLSEVVVITRILRVYASGEKSLYMLVGLGPAANPINFCIAVFLQSLCLPIPALQVYKAPESLKHSSLRVWLGMSWERWECDSPDEGRLRLAAGVSEVQNQREISVVNGDTGDIDDARDALLELC